MAAHAHSQSNDSNPPSSKQDFLTLLDLPAEALQQIVEAAKRSRVRHTATQLHQPLIGRTAGLILELNSTRTRVGFEAGMHQLGGHTVLLDSKTSQLGRGEPIADTARVLSEMLDAIIIRTLAQSTVTELAEYASVPVINAMTGKYHPLQLLADVQTFEELRGPISGANVAFVGDGYNMCHSYINAARQWGFQLKIACPKGFEPDPDILAAANGATLVDSPSEAVTDADLVVTDVWSSMGHEAEQAKRLAAFASYQVNEGLLDQASSDVLFMHCLPAHRGEEISETLFDDPRSAVWQEAGNRMHTQKALLCYLLGVDLG
ncbi:MAG: ornithine carbamoyltransferase [Pseudomonadales bacterium]